MAEKYMLRKVCGGVLCVGNYHPLQTLKINERLSTSSVILDRVTEGTLPLLP